MTSLFELTVKRDLDKSSTRSTGSDFKHHLGRAPEVSRSSDAEVMARFVRQGHPLGGSLFGEMNPGTACPVV